MKHIATMSPLVGHDEGGELRYLYRPIVFAEPDRAVRPPSWLDYTPFAFWIVDALRPSVFVELGCHSGNSYASFAQAVQTLGLSTACYGVDTWRGDEQAGFFDESVFEDWSAYHDRRFSTFSRLIRSTFDEAREHFADGSIDLIHLDGCHTFDAVSHDFETWRPKLSSRGVLLCHDINVRETDFGAWRLWKELKNAYPSFEFLHGHGLGVLGIGRDLPEALQWLFSLRTHDPESANAVRLFFARLGSAVVQRHKANEAQERLQTELASRDVQLTQAHADAAGLRNEMVEANERHTKMAAEVERLQTALADSASRISDAVGEVDRLRLELDDSNQRSRRVEADSIRARERWERATRTLATRASRISSLTSSIAAANTELERRAHQIDRFALTMARLRERANTLASDLDARDAQMIRLRRDFARVPDALRDRDTLISELDAQLALSLERLERQGQHLRSDSRRRTELEAIVTWSQAQLAQLSNGPDSGSLRKALRRAFSPRRRRALQAIEASGLFDAAYYAAQQPPLDPGASANALLHYVTQGWRTGRAPHPLFDPAYYLAQSPDAVGAGCDPLAHYLTHGVGAGRNPHPLFDVAFYLRENPDVMKSGTEPLTHFLQKGAREGRRPNDWFDVEAYVARNPDLQDSGENPLVHYRLHGGEPPQGPIGLCRADGGPFGSIVAIPSRIQLAPTPLAPATANRPTILVVSHVGPWQPKAGNEYRVRRMLQWYQRRGYSIIPVIAPLPGEELSAEAVAAIAAEFRNAVQCHRDGRVEYLLHDAPDALASLSRTFTPSFGALLGEGGTTPHQRELLQLERTFCHDVVASTVLQLSRALGPHVLQVEYIWMTRLLPLVHGPVLKVVDTIDVFSSIREKVAAFGIADIDIEPDEEAERLRRADLAIAIHDDERAALIRLAPTVPVVTAGVDFDLADEDVGAVEPRILYVGSSNSRNQRGLDDFLRLAWPRIQRRIPNAELVIAGSVGDKVAPRELPGVRTVGAVEDLTALYRGAAVVVNPAVAGTGLKIKILEALSHSRPIVTWPSGVDGLNAALASFCFVARDWFEFSEQVVGVLTNVRRGPFTSSARAVIAEHVAPEHVYAALDAQFTAFFDRHHVSEAARSRGGRATSLMVGHANG